MKKFFAIAMIAGALTACNNSGSSSTTSDSSSTVAPDTTVAPVAPAPDTSNKMMTDTSKMKSDTSKMKKKK